jgi:hypothetical protein
MQFLKLSAVFLYLAFAACGGSPSPATSTISSTTPAQGTSNAGDPSCPVAVAGTSVTVEDAPNGAALVFITTGDVAEVRRRVAAMASMHNEHHGAMGPLPDGSDAGGGHAGHDMSGHAGHDMAGGGAHAGHDMAGGGAHAGHDMAGGGAHAGHAGGMIGVHTKAAASDVEGGAKLLFIANAGDVAKLQSELRMHAQHLGAGTCGMAKS